MKDYKKSRGCFGWMILLAIVTGMGLGVYQVLVPSTQVDEKAILANFNKDTDYCYFYEKLNENEQDTYRRIYHSLTESLESIVLKETDVEIVQDVFTNVLFDHPELYYVNSQFEYRQNPNSIEFMPRYDYTEAEIENYNKQIEEKMSGVIEQARQESTKNQQARYIYNYLIQNVEYQENRKTDQNIISSLLEGKSVCAGYARAYQYLLGRLGIDSAYIVGTAKESNSQILSGDRHAWVMVNLDGDYYYSDPTWGDVAEKGMTHTCYAYFMMNSQDMLMCYEPEVDYEKTRGDKNYYFEEEGCYLKNYDEEVISQAVKVGLNNKSRVAEIKCANETIYKRVKKAMESSYLAYRILNQNGCWSDNATYLCIDELKLVEIYY